jgi:hypothetical protein
VNDDAVDVVEENVEARQVEASERCPLSAIDIALTTS